jgi:asparagine synthase (glutamine-hydrolysing)
MAMAHSVEGRFPFLDCRVVEFCNRLPSNLKLRGLTDKYLLRKLGAHWLPEDVCVRPKRPYRAPIHRSFFNTSTPDYVRELLSPHSIAQAGFFKPAAVVQLIKKVEDGMPLGETDDMALAGILSTQLVQHRFVERFETVREISTNEPVKICVAAR